MRDLPAEYFGWFLCNRQLYFHKTKWIGGGIHPYFLIQSSFFVAAADDLTFGMLVCLGS